MKEVISGLTGNPKRGKKVKSVTFFADNPIYWREKMPKKRKKKPMKIPGSY